MNERRKTGTYVSASYTRKSEDALWTWCRGPEGVDRPVHITDFHSTILYSRNELNNFPKPIYGKVKPIGFHLFPSDKGEEYRSLVILLDAPNLCEYHNKLIQAGGTHDFPDYVPHISVTYYADKDIDLSWRKLPDFELEIYGIMMCPLDLNWNDSND